MTFYTFEHSLTKYILRFDLFNKGIPHRLYTQQNLEINKQDSSEELHTLQNVSSIFSPVGRVRVPVGRISIRLQQVHLPDISIIPNYYNFIDEVICNDIANSYTDNLN